jgi:hypothetical protein
MDIERTTGMIQLSGAGFQQSVVWRCKAWQSAGAGREEYCPLRQVSFEPEKRETVLIKDAWRETLCSMISSYTAARLIEGPAMK